MFRITSLRGLLLGYNLAFLLLIAVTGAMGWIGVEIRQQAAEETLRLNSMLALAQQTRGDVYRQMTQVFDHHFLAEPRATTEYRASSERIAANFGRLEEFAALPAEQEAVEGLRLAYELVRVQTDDIMAVPSSAFREAEHLAVFFTADLEMAWLDDYERVFAANDELMRIAQAAEEQRVSRLNRGVALAFAVPLAMAAGMLLLSRALLNRAFVRPVRGLLQAVAAFGQGRLDHKVAEEGATELVTLERAVNRMARDLSESREALVRSEKQAALGALVPVVAHNIRNPLASIRATAQVHDQTGTPPDVATGLRDIRGTVDRLEQWLSALLSYLNPLRLSCSEVRLSAVADAALKLLEPRIEAKSLVVRRGGWADSPAVSADERLLEQAVYGLLVNAVDASPQGGRLALALTQRADAVVLTIRDHGPGMPFRPSPGDLTPGPTTKSFGSGLGIPFAFKVCDLHDGGIEFRTPSDGGTEVAVSLPVVGAGGAP